MSLLELSLLDCLQSLHDRISALEEKFTYHVEIGPHTEAGKNSAVVTLLTSESFDKLKVKVGTALKNDPQAAVAGFVQEQDAESIVAASEINPQATIRALQHSKVTPALVHKIQTTCATLALIGTHLLFVWASTFTGSSGQQVSHVL